MTSKNDKTPFQVIIDAFYDIVTDDMYMEWTPEETAADLTNLLLAAIPNFQFPRFKLYDYSEIPEDNVLLPSPEVTLPPTPGGVQIDPNKIPGMGLPTDEEEEPETRPSPEEEETAPVEKHKRYQYNCVLTREEISILARLMIIEWLNRQIACVDVVRQKYSSKDFSFTSQANHLSKLISLKENFQVEDRAAQRLYNRHHIKDDGYIRPNYRGLGGKTYVRQIWD